MIDTYCIHRSITNYHPEKAFLVDLMCLFVIKTKQKRYEHDEIISSDYLKKHGLFFE